MDFDQKRERIMAIDAEMRRLENEKDRLTGELVAACGHESLIEMDGESTSCGFEPPIRLCLICGYEETAGRGDEAFPILRNEPIKRRVDLKMFKRCRRLQPLTAAVTMELTVKRKCRVPVPEGVLP